MTRTRVPYSSPYINSLAISTSPFLCEPGGVRERNVFLRSYTFSVRESYGERLKRSLKELNNWSKGLFWEIYDGISDGRFGMRVFRAMRSRLQLGPNFELNPLKCFGAQKNYCLKNYG